jgi:hypothetical protein
MTDDERAASLDRKDAKLEETKRIAANTQRLNRLARIDPEAGLRELFDAEPKPPEPPLRRT